MSDVEELWNQATTDAGFNEADQAYCYPLPGRPGFGYWAMYFDPGRNVEVGPEFPLSPDQATNANKTHLQSHRVVVFAGVTRPELAGLMRHELEHARQYQVLGELGFRVYARTRDALGDLYGGGAGSAAIYSAIPMERDADAAAAAHIRAIFGEVDPTISEGEHAQLFRHPEGPEPIDGLGRRSLAFAAVHGTVFGSWVSTNGETVTGLFASLVEEAEERWRTIVHDEEVKRLASQSLSAVPTDAEIVAAGDRPASAWARSRDLLVVAYRRGLTLIA
jgi:hypothetical protein